MGTVIRQATLNALLSYLGIALGFVKVVGLYPKVLQTDEFGLTRLLLSVTTMAAQIAQLGAENTIIRYFPYFRDRERARRERASRVHGVMVAEDEHSRLSAAAPVHVRADRRVDELGCRPEQTDHHAGQEPRVNREPVDVARR